MKYTSIKKYEVEKALRKVQALLGTEKHPRLASDDPNHTVYNDKYALAEFVTNTSVASQLTILEHLGLTTLQLQTLLKWVHEDHDTVTMQFQAEDGCSFLKEQDVEVLSSPKSTTTDSVTEATVQTQQQSSTASSSSSSFFGSTANTLFDRSGGIGGNSNKTNRVVTKIKEYHWKVYVSYKLKLFKGNNSNPDDVTGMELQSRNASTILITSGGQATSPVRRGPNAGGHRPVPPIAEKTVHPPCQVSLTWLLQTLESVPKQPQAQQPQPTASSSINDKSTEDDKDKDNTNSSSNNNGGVRVLSQFSIDRSVSSCRTPRRNEPIQAALEYHQSLIHWMLSVLNFFLDRLEKEILAKHNPAVPFLPLSSSNSNKNMSNNNNNKNLEPKLELSTICQMVGVEKDPKFNGKSVVVKEYLASADRYRVEPLNASDGLPSSLTIKKANLTWNNAKQSSSTTTTSSSTTTATTTTGSPTSPLPGTGPWLSRVSVEDVFVPALPLFVDGTVLSDANVLLQAQAQSIQQAFEKQIVPIFPPRQLAKLASQAEAKMLLLCTHWLDLIEHYQNSMNCIEHMIRQQLVQAIGKEVQSTDLHAFWRMHFPKLWGGRLGGGSNVTGSPYAPKPFIYNVRRPQHYPDGLVSIEFSSSSSSSSTTTTTTSPSIANATTRMGNPSIQTLVRHVPGGDGTNSPSIFIPIHATTCVEITGDCYLHGWMQHHFESSSSSSSSSPSIGSPIINNNNNNNSPPLDSGLQPLGLMDSTTNTEYRLVARARQFTNFLLIVGNLSSPNTLDPKAAIVIQNKDEVLIPLLTQVLPTSQEFKDAIASLSEEQQAFCHAFRGMQLDSSVFGICIIQLKPQLELLLGLPNKALTKEIQLTQDLMSLFVEYQIPSDLVSYDDENDDEEEEIDSAATTRTAAATTVTTTTKGSRKLAAVKAHVKTVMTAIEAEKEKQVAEEEQKAEMRGEITHSATSGKDEQPDKSQFDEDEQGGGDSTSHMDQATVSSSMVAQASMSSRSTVRRLHKSRSGGSGRNQTGAAPTMPTVAETMPASSSQQVSPVMKTQTQSMFIKEQQPPQVTAVASGESTGAVIASPTSADAMTPSTMTGMPLSSQTANAATISLDDDFTLIPKLLDAKLDQYDTDHSLRSTIVTAGPIWTRTRQDNLLSGAKSSTLSPEAIERETNKAFDLLDALSRSGTLPIACSELHVIIAVSHCFENDVMGTVIQDNVNPIEKMERSSLILGSTIHQGESWNTLLADSEEAERLRQSLPLLFLSES